MSDERDFSRQPQRNRSGKFSSVQVMFAAILAIGLALAISLSSRILAGQPLDEAYRRVQAEIEQLRREQAELLAVRDRVMSDAFVEQWARDEGKMIREGEVLVIPVPSGINIAVTPTPAPTVDVETSPPEPDAWALWWALFFDSPPPDFSG